MNENRLEIIKEMIEKYEKEILILQGCILTLRTEMWRNDYTKGEQSK